MRQLHWLSIPRTALLAMALATGGASLTAWDPASLPMARLDIPADNLTSEPWHTDRHDAAVPWATSRSPCRLHPAVHHRCTSRDFLSLPWQGIPANYGN